MSAIHSTAMSSAFEQAGFNIVAARFRRVLHDALAKHHGNIDRSLKTAERQIDGADDLIREALRMCLIQLRGDGPDVHAGDACHKSIAAPSQPNGDAAGHDVRVSNDPLKTAGASPPNRGGAGPLKNDTHAESAGPVREPSKAQLDAERAVRIAASRPVLDSYVIDGRPIGDWSVGEALSRGRLMTANGRILLRTARLVANADHSALLRNVAKAIEVDCIIAEELVAADVL